MCDQVAALLPERAAELKALKSHIEGTGAPYSFLGNRYFWNSDFMTHQREAYYFSVKMVSHRTIGTESFGGENVKGAWLPFGATWIVPAWRRIQRDSPRLGLGAITRRNLAARRH